MSIFKVIVKGHWLDSLDETRNVFCITGDGVPLWTDVNAHFRGLWNPITDPLIAQVSNTWQMYAIEVQEKAADAPNDWLTLYEYSSTMTGVNTNDPLPHTSAACIVGITSSRSRAKKYIAGICENDQSAGRIGATLTNALLSFATQWTTDFISDGNTYKASVYRVAHDDAPSITGFRVDALLATQRRRKQGRGM